MAQLRSIKRNGIKRNTCQFELGISWDISRGLSIWGQLLPKYPSPCIIPSFSLSPPLSIFMRDQRATHGHETYHPISSLPSSLPPATVRNPVLPLSSSPVNSQRQGQWKPNHGHVSLPSLFNSCCWQVKKTQAPLYFSPSFISLHHVVNTGKPKLTQPSDLSCALMEANASPEHGRPWPKPANQRPTRGLCHGASRP